LIALQAMPTTAAGWSAAAVVGAAALDTAAIKGIS
jgi:hypothetical protein